MIQPLVDGPGLMAEPEPAYTTHLPCPNVHLVMFPEYDAVSDVVESGGLWRYDFQIGSRVLKICFKPILMHIYGMQYDFMHRSC